MELHIILTSKPVEVYSHLLAVSCREATGVRVGRRVSLGILYQRKNIFPFQRIEPRPLGLHPVVHSPACFSQLRHIDMTFYRNACRADCCGFLSEHVRCSSDTTICHSPVAPRLSLCGPEICDGTESSREKMTLFSRGHERRKNGQNKENSFLQ